LCRDDGHLYRTGNSALSRFEILVRYILFAVIATVLNLSVQRLVLALDEHWSSLYLAMFLGTLVGLAAKFMLDKRWIFQASQNRRASAMQFSLYSLTGVVTTCLFWSLEAAFWYVGRTDLMRETGAVIGLALGYALKYRLDKRYVF
jgi:putative flippase GtrA